MDSREQQEVSDWCRCGKCSEMPTHTECICCVENEKVQEKMKEAKENPKCITLHPDFEDIYKLHGAEDRECRYAAYRQFTRWCLGHLGKNNRVPLPACVVTTIRKKFPSETETYAGFQEAQLE